MSEPLSYEPHLIDGIRRGDPDAWTTFYNGYKLVLYHFVRQVVADPDIAQDVVSDVFATAWQLKANFEAIADLRAYMYVSCRNRAYDHLRQASMQQRHEQLVTETYYPDPDTVDSRTAMEIVRSELLHFLYKEIQALPPRLSQIAHLMFIEGLSTTLIAEKLSLSPQTVRNSKTSIVEKLRHVAAFKGIELMVVMALAYQLSAKKTLDEAFPYATVKKVEKKVGG